MCRSNESTPIGDSSGDIGVGRLLTTVVLIFGFHDDQSVFILSPLLNTLC